MLAVTTYPAAYIDECRLRMETQLATYEALVAALEAGPSSPAVGPFEPLFLGHLTLALDQYFVHRTRAIEGKDGNPLNEVRMLCNSILRGQNVFTADKSIKYKPEESVLGYNVGDQITLDLTGFRRLSAAFFDEIEKRFT
jgi:hypothetical protein